MPLVYTFWITLSATLAIAGHYLALDWLHWIFKPATTLLIAVWAWRAQTVERGYQRVILIGLLLSCLGDVFLMLPGDWFLHGLVSFLLAHVGYLFAFRLRAPWVGHLWPFLLYALIAAPIVWILWPYLPSLLRAPVLLYVAALAAMAAQATAVWWRRRDRLTALAAIGGASFVLSDAILAWNRFVDPFEAGRLANLLSYWLAQWLIALSVATSVRSR
ncbi:lysoplasmalogenase [Pseudomarimonas arenosa]|uniref:Lysoplasmalogenase n=1 Tax=Pseudomarimonas arenosa TaxID=2774145 RepID=A0AAW3ZVN8_9GAMM|nr:lysoplasmalogenase [Pseudomarimonas arenosa]MBD8528101.1 lysoplasmalogenase [Pseudomarimonas arenosa]